MSDWKQSANRRRNARQATPLDAPPGPSANGKKNTRRWCRGKAGVEHKGECRDYNTTKHTAPRGALHIFTHWRILVCVNCGKELDWWAPPMQGIPHARQRPKPDWVTQ